MHRSTGQRSLPLSLRLPRVETEVRHGCRRTLGADATLRSVISESGVHLTLHCPSCRTWVDWDLRLWDLPRELSRSVAQAAARVAETAELPGDDVVEHLASALRQARAMSDELALESSRGFAAEVAATVYWVVRHDASGRVLQLAEQQPGVMLLAAHTAPFDPVVALTTNPLPHIPIWRDVIDGRPLRVIVDALAHRLGEPEAHRARLRWLSRRVARSSSPQDVLAVSRLAAVPPSDLPEGPVERGQWLGVLADLRGSQTRDDGWVRYLSARYREAASLEPVQLDRVFRYVRAGGRSPSRKLPFERLAERAERYHEHWSHERDAREVLAELERRRARLPAPPLPDLDDEGVRITAIRTVRELFDEGQRMAHCIFSYWEDTLAGDVAVYHVEVGVEASTALLAVEDGRWSIVEQNGARNGRVSQASRMATRQWAHEVRR